MIENYELILGLEVHMQITTKEKMFCACKNDPFSSEPNANVCPVCLGLPGAMPVPNLESFKLAQKMAVAIGSKLNNKIIFERKNYFYPDLPKGFQITCPHDPISIGGEFTLRHLSSEPKIKWSEIHLEEDTAKSQHDGNITKIDFNKSGVPLLEMVTEPIFRDTDTAVEFCKEIQLTARHLGVSEADMEKGHMRLEANISVRKIGEKDLPNYKVEIKNINSFAFMKKAVEYELRRQVEAIEAGEKLIQETRGFNENTGKTFSQRNKEEANDYRYFPEPDIPVIDVDQKWIDEITTSVTTTPQSIRSGLIDSGLTKIYANILVANDLLLEKFNKLVSKGIDSKSAANWIINTPAYSEMSVDEIINDQESKNKDKITDSTEIEEFIDEVIVANDKAVSDYKSGNLGSLQFLVGQVMKISRGKADAAIVKKLLEEKLANN